MAATAGKSGSLKIGENAVANLKSWKLDINQDLKETTNFASNGWKEQTPTIKSFSGSVDGDWNMADATGQKAMQDALLGGTTVSGVFGTDGTHTYTGNAFIKKISVQEQVDDIVKFTADIEGTGALTYA